MVQDLKLCVLFKNIMTYYMNSVFLNGLYTSGLNALSETSNLLLGGVNTNNIQILNPIIGDGINNIILNNDTIIKEILTTNNISTSNLLTKKLIVNNSTLFIEPQIYTDTLYSTKINTTLYTEKPSGTIILGNNIITTIPKLILNNNMSIASNKILGNITNINCENIIVTDNIQHLPPERLYFDSTNKTITTITPTANNVTDIALNIGTGNVSVLIDTYTFIPKPFINFIGYTRILIELRVPICVTNSNFGSQLYFEIYKNNQLKGRSYNTYYINETTIDENNPYIVIMDITLEESNINDVFSIKPYFYYTNNSSAYIGKINLNKSYLTINYNHNKGYEYIEKNRYHWADVQFTRSNVDSFYALPFFIFKGCWIVETNLTFNIAGNGTYNFYIRTKDNITNTFINTTQYYSVLTTAGGNHTFKISQIINTPYTYMQLQQCITWIDYAGLANITLRGSTNNTYYIRFIKIG